MDRKMAVKKATELVEQMTVEEMASQLRFDAPAIERLGIPEYNWWNEGLPGGTIPSALYKYPCLPLLPLHYTSLLSLRRLPLRFPLMWETYLPAFEACVLEAEVESVMGAYNRTNGEPCCGHSYLMDEVLRAHTVSPL